VGVRVLLFSPLAGLDPASGDVAYTEALLTDPPAGVTYTTYEEALAQGLLRIRGRRPRHGRLAIPDALLLLVRTFELLLRRVRVMYREPTWFVTVDADAFDVVHQHLFAVRQVGRRVPVVSSAGYPLSVLYADRDGWTPGRVKVATGLERLWARALDIHNPGLRSTRGSLMTVYTERFRDHLVRLGVDPEVIQVCGTGLPEVPVPPSRSDGRTVGFIGRDFVSKGGDVVLAAFLHLREADPALRLRIITSADSAARHVPPGADVELFTDVPNSEILDRHLPEIDVLLLPTNADCGAPYGVLEALRSGVSVVTSWYPWLDERLVPPAVVRVSAEPTAVASAAGRMLDPSRLGTARAAARELWAQEFSMDVLGPRLGEAYGRVVGRGR
jgi:glycosyltransferase involved in cell wall biosynthesis